MKPLKNHSCRSDIANRRQAARARRPRGPGGLRPHRRQAAAGVLARRPCIRGRKAGQRIPDQSRATARARTCWRSCRSTASTSSPGRGHPCSRAATCSRRVARLTSGAGAGAWPDRGLLLHLATRLLRGAHRPAGRCRRHRRGAVPQETAAAAAIASRARSCARGRARAGQQARRRALGTGHGRHETSHAVYVTSSARPARRPRCSRSITIASQPGGKRRHPRAASSSRRRRGPSRASLPDPREGG